jgi:hypothetical protein
VWFTVAMLQGVSAYNPSTLVGAAGMLVIVPILAALVPALRAATVDPITSELPLTHCELQASDRHLSLLCLTFSQRALAVLRLRWTK